MKLSAHLAGIALATLLVGCGDDGASEPRLMPTAASPMPPEHSPTPTPAPACEPLYPDVGFPVMVGRAGDAACVVWKGAPGAPAQVRVQDGAFQPGDRPAFELLYSATAGSPFVFPPDALPPFRGTDRCFDSDTGFTVRVDGAGGTAIGAEAWSTCTRIIILADGCTSGFPFDGQDATVGRRPSAAGGQLEACVMWADKAANESGFRIKLSYPNSGETFTYLAPPNTVEFVPPAGDTLGLGSPSAGLGRKDWTLEVVAITPTGDVPIGVQSVQVM